MNARRAVRPVLAGIVVAGLLGYVGVSLWPVREAAASGVVRPAEAQPMVVVEVLSGDTVVLSSQLPGAQVRDHGRITAKLLSIDAPNFGLQSECYAVEAEGRLVELLPEGSIAWVATDTVVKDDNGRWLMNVWAADGRYVNYLLAVDGFVRAKEMRAGASAAARFGGLWGVCS